MGQSRQTWLLIAAGVATACLVFATPILADLYYTAGLLLFGYGVIKAIYSAGPRRAFWVGFVIVFAIYNFSTTWALLPYGSVRGGASSGIITTRLLAVIYEGMNPALSYEQSRFLAANQPMSLPGNLYGGYIAFLTMGHMLIALGLSVVGGQFAQRLSSLSSPTGQRSLEEILQGVDD